ncbi:MAG: ABC transporter permease [Bacteroidota bacterium]
MIKNIFRIIFRNISRQKGFTIINVTGLAVGLAASLLILMWVMDELSYENFNEHAGQIYMVNQDQFYTGERFRVAVTPHPCAPVWKERIPEIKEASRIVFLPRMLFRIGDKVFFETQVKAADSGILKVFTLPLIHGDAQSALRDPHSIILSEKLAKKYFGNDNPVGKIITIENKYPFTVSAVMRTIPKNSVFSTADVSRFGVDAIIPYSFLKEIGMSGDSWGNNSILTYLLLERGADIKSVNKKLTGIVVEHNPETNAKFFLTPWLDFRLHTQFGFEDGKGAIVNIYIFAAIALFILLIACINFINLAIAKAATRGKEIGIKKVAGANRLTMAFQFMTESVVLVLIALVFALVLVGLLLGIFNSISGKSFTVADIFQAKFIAGFIITGLVTGILAGIYPAFYLSSLKPVMVLKGETVSGKRNGRLRQILVVVQFALSIFIALGAIFMYLQLKFMQEKELGFDKENLICIPMTQNVKARYYSLKKELLKEPLINGVSAASHNPTMIGSNGGGASWKGKDPKQEVLIGQCVIDYDYLSTMKMSLVAGRDFSRDHPADMGDTLGNFLVNEEVVRLMGGGDAVGKSFRFMGQQGIIVGVMKNFHYSGAQEPIEPMAFAVSDSKAFSNILVRLAPGDLPVTLKTVEKIWKKVIPDYPFVYSFIDQDYDNLYRTEIRMGLLLKYFTMVALIIACLGLYGLSTYAASRRTREIGVRKVMGAGVVSVIFALSKEFLILVIIAIAIAFPLGWYAVHKMLLEFAYRINLDWLVFGAIGLGALAVALATVSFQAYKASCVNPAVALKTE